MYRGEQRCLPDYLICDGKVDCMYSSDDEFSCKLCPPTCNCSSYTILCFDSPPANYIAPFKAFFSDTKLNLIQSHIGQLV